jgi:hypothetical protein
MNFSRNKKRDDSHQSNEIHVRVLYESEELQTVKFTEKTDIFESTFAQIDFEQLNRWPTPLNDNSLRYSKYAPNTALFGINPIYLLKGGEGFQCRANLMFIHYLDERF